MPEAAKPECVTFHHDQSGNFTEGIFVYQGKHYSVTAQPAYEYVDPNDTIIRVPVDEQFTEVNRRKFQIHVTDIPGFRFNNGPDYPGDDWISFRYLAIAYIDFAVGELMPASVPWAKLQTAVEHDIHSFSSDPALEYRWRKAFASAWHGFKYNLEQSS